MTPVLEYLTTRGGIRFTYPNPFAKNHCVVHSLTHLAGGDRDFALSLAERAYLRGRLSRAGSASQTYDNLAWWVEAAGLRLVRKVRLLRGRWRHEASLQQARALGYTPVSSQPTLKTFARQHPRGRFIVFVSGHAVALIDGKFFGSWRSRSVVLSYAEVEAV